MKAIAFDMREQGKRNALLIAGFVALNILDVVLTLLAYRNGGYELNPIARFALDNQNFWTLWLVKIVGVTALTMTLLFLATKYPRQIRWTFVGLIGIFAGVCIVNFMGAIQ